MVWRDGNPFSLVVIFCRFLHVSILGTFLINWPLRRSQPVSIWFASLTEMRRGDRVDDAGQRRPFSGAVFIVHRWGIAAGICDATRLAVEFVCGVILSTVPLYRPEAGVISRTGRGEFEGTSTARGNELAARKGHTGD